MKSNITRIIRVVLLLDRSGSMCSVVPETIKGVNQAIKVCKNAAKDNSNLDVRFTLVGFDTPETDAIIDDMPIEKVKNVTTNEIFGRAGTPLYGAIGSTIDHIKKLTKDNVLFIVFTDGQNTDRVPKYMPDVVSKMVLGFDKWTFALVAANQDEQAVAKDLNIKHAMKYQSTSSGTRSAFYQLSRSIRKYLENKSEDISYIPSEFFETPVEESKSLMSINGLSCILNLPEAIKEDDEKTDELPPYAPVPSYVVDEYPACPSDWMHGSSRSSSYFVPVQTGHGMWLDFNKCREYSHDVAIVISVQGVNPVTGQKTGELRLEQYKNKCPVHNVDFRQDRFCPECQYKWPAQNYISSKDTEPGRLWIDGFLTPDGSVKQYVFTNPEEMRGVAKSIIGNDAVYAIGIAFYKMKKEKFQERGFLRGGYDGLSRKQYGGKDPYGFVKCCSMSVVGTATMDFDNDDNLYSCSGIPMAAAAPARERESKTSGGIMSLSDITTLKRLKGNGIVLSDVEEVKATKLDVAAGESIKQRIADDTSTLDDYEAEPIGMIYINYSTKESIDKILEAGKRKEEKSGFLKQVKVGNP